MHWTAPQIVNDPMNKSSIVSPQPASPILSPRETRGTAKEVLSSGFWVLGSGLEGEEREVLSSELGPSPPGGTQNLELRTRRSR